MKKFLLVLISCISSCIITAQDPTFNKGDKVLNLGIGFGNTLYSGSGYTTTVPPISASFEIGAIDEVIDVGTIGIGGYLGYSAFKWEYNWWGDTWGYKYTDLIIGARGAFHYPLVNKLDTYSGLLIGYEIINGKEYGTFLPNFTYSSSSSGAIWAWYLGGRYYFSEKVSGMMELGYGISYLTFGLGVKL